MKTSIELEQLLGAVPDAEVFDMKNDVVRSVTSDSRSVEKGDVFVAVKGFQSDGHNFIADAVDRGAAAVVSERQVDVGGIPNIVVKDSAKTLSTFASEIAGNPAQSLRMFGVTGTNGKTSTTQLFSAIWERASLGGIGVIGTLGHGVRNKLHAGIHTTPEPVSLQRHLSGMRDEGCIGVVMEVSSHAVRQQRTWGIDFELGMLTNITRDHLDYHPTFDDYVDAKREFCFSLVAKNRKKKSGVLVYSNDNEHTRKIGESFPGRKYSVSVEGNADIQARAVEASLSGTRFMFHADSKEIEINLRLLGSFSVANALMAAAAAYVTGIDLDAIKSGLESVDGVPGRFEAIGGAGTPTVIVDYCHTPDSLERTLQFCLALKPRRLITVFGCGGDRDRGKRPEMGAIAQKYSHECYVTSDNPRTEDPRAIIDEILTGMDQGQSGFHVQVDRRKAIHAAIHDASEGDLVTICGKGHEDYQIIGTTRHHFDDREETRQALSQWKRN